MKNKDKIKQIQQQLNALETQVSMLTSMETGQTGNQESVQRFNAHLGDDVKYLVGGV